MVVLNSKSPPLSPLTLEELQLTPQEKRNRIQQIAVSHFFITPFSNKPYRIAYYMGTGVGKSKTAIDTAKAYLNTVPGEGEVLIACHSTAAETKIWPDELNKWDTQNSIKERVHLSCYQSLHTIKKRHFKVVILDEAHKITLRSFKFFEQNTVEAVIVLTATRPRDIKKQELLDSLVGSNEFKYTQDQAIADGILNDYEVHVYRVSLDNTLPVVPQYKGGPLVTEWQAYLQHCVYLTNTDEHGGDTKLIYINMMRFLGDSPTKTKAAQYIISRLRDRKRRFIVFSSSIAQTTKLSPYQYHSETDDKAFLALCNLEIDELASVNQIQEGANVPNLDRAVAIQLNTNPLNVIQRIGRLLRKEVGTVSSMFVIVAKDTYDEHWCKKALSQTPNEKIKYHDLDKDLYWQLPG